MTSTESLSSERPEFEPTDLNRGDVELLDQQTVFQGYFRMDRYQVRHRKYDGQWSRPVTREVLERGHAAAVLPYDPVLDRVVLVEQFRAGVYAHGQIEPDARPWQIEIIAGIIDAGETAESVARREALEKANCELAGDLLPVMDYYISPGAVSEFMEIYCGRCNSKNLGGTHGLDQENEDIRVLAMPFQRAIKLLNTGKIQNSAAVIALQWLQLNHAKVRKQLLASD